MRHAILLLGLIASALPAAAARPWPDPPGAALAAIQLPPCDYRTDYWTPVGSLSAKLSEGHHAAVEAELEELHGAFEKNHACENRMKWAALPRTPRLNRKTRFWGTNLVAQCFL